MSADQARKRKLTAEELVERHRRLPRVDGRTLRADADAFFGTEDRIDDDGPWSRRDG